VDEELFVGRVKELTAVVAQRDGGDEDVDVRMVQHPPGPGLQHGDKAAFATEVLRLAKEIAERLGALGK
jgi:hypothetical protein